jgi:hypothetical protein
VFSIRVFVRLCRKIEGFLALLRAKSDVAIATREGDDDGKNRRMMRYERRLMTEAGILHSYWACSLHSSAKLVGDACSHIGRSIVDGLFAYSKLVRMGNFFARTTLAVLPLVSHELRVLYEPQPLCIAKQRSVIVD